MRSRSGNSPLAWALFAFLPACSSGLDFDGLSRDYGKDGGGCTTGVGPNCDDVASGLAGLRVELRCNGPGAPDYTCASDPIKQQTATLRGTAGTTYRLTLRFRGVVEKSNYMGATGDPPFQVGGTSTSGAYNTYTLAVSDPGQTFDLNGSTMQPPAWSEPVDVTETVLAKAMATLTLTADPKDTLSIKNVDSNGNPNPSPGGVEPTAMPFPGQFMQVDVLSVATSP